jgi:MFS family permease
MNRSVLPVLYGVVVLTSAAMAFEGPARASLLPTLVPRELFPSAVVVNSASQNISWMTGPVLMGFVISYAGVAAAYAAHVCIVLGSLALLSLVRARHVRAAGRVVSLQAIREGLTFVRSRQTILGAMTLDMFAVIFGGAPRSPDLRTDILHVGCRLWRAQLGQARYGLDVRDPAGIAADHAPGPCPAVRGGGVRLRDDRFGLSLRFPLSLAAVVAGMADQISMVTRQMIISSPRPRRAARELGELHLHRRLEPARRGRVRVPRGAHQRDVRRGERRRRVSRGRRAALCGLRCLG